MVKLLYSCFERKLTSAELENYLALLPSSVRVKTLEFKRWQDMQAYLYGKLLLLKGLEQLGVKCSLESLQYTIHNRPYINEKIDFNISHSGDYVICVLSDSLRIGIDIERINSICIEDFACYMLPNEWNEIVNSGNSFYEFYNYWTKKECVVKADGRGLTIPLEEVIIQGNQATVENTTWYLSKVELIDKYVVHLASNQELVDPIISKIEF